MIILIIYVVKRGDSVYSIAKRFGAEMDRVIYANQLTEPDRLAVGQALVIPDALPEYTVRRGDTMFSIAEKNGISLGWLAAANPQISNPARIYPGQRLYIPQLPGREIVVDGYTSRISDASLRQQAPYLTFLSPFSYMVSDDGGLEASFSVNEELASGLSAARLMTVTNLKPGGGFSSDTAHAILTQQGAQNAFIENALNKLREGWYYGLSLDFEYVYPFDRESYMQFLSRLARELHSSGFVLSVAAAPKTSTSQPGFLYVAHDYARMGEAADFVVLMTYEWGYTYGPAMAVSPIDMVRRVLDYAAAEIPPEKLLMGMPNYGYDWTLPFKAGSAAKTITNTAAPALAARAGAEIFFDDKSQAPFFRYYDNSGAEHEVWFEDARSVKAKLGLVGEYSLAGVSVWNINSLFRAMWLVLESLYGSEKVQ